jgi:hypothetical protein
MNFIRRLHLTENSPTAIKVKKLFNFARELGLTLSYFGYRTIVEDRDRDKSLPPLYMEDTASQHNIAVLPSPTDYTLVYSNPTHSEELKKRIRQDKKVDSILLARALSSSSNNFVRTKKISKKISRDDKAKLMLLKLRSKNEAKEEQNGL